MYCVLCHYPKWKVVFMPLMGFMSAVDDPVISCVATGDLPHRAQCTWVGAPIN